MESPPPPSSGSANRSAGRVWQPPSPEVLEAQLPQYKVLEILGRGGMGAVYKGWQVSLDRYVAIKILPPDLDGEEANFTARFQQEAKTMARLSHPGIVPVYDAGRTPEGLRYFIMEFIEGTDVARMIKKQGRLPPEDALAITAHICDALEYAHGQGVIHRDIKPANVMVNTQGTVKVADFGLAKLTTRGESGLTKTSMAMGTPDFMAPESLIEGEIVDQRADTYAVGVMFYQMLTGTVPRGVFPPPSQKISGLDPRYDQIVLKAMQINREHRYSSASAIRSELDRILSHPVPKEKPPEAPLPHRHLEIRRNAVSERPVITNRKPSPTPWIWASLLLLTVVLGSFFFWSSNPSSAGKTSSRTEQGGVPVPSNYSSNAVAASPKSGGAGDSPSGAEQPSTTKASVSSGHPPEPVPSSASTAAASPQTSASDTSFHSASIREPKAQESSSTSTAPPLPLEVTIRLNEIRLAYESYVGTHITKPHEIAVAALEANYLKALGRTLDEATKHGALEMVVAAKAEIERITKHQALPLADDSLPVTIKNLRATFLSELSKLENARDAELPDANQRYNTALAQYQAQLTQNKQVDAALRVKVLRERVALPSRTNSLGMKFVPVPGTKVWFCIHDTRKADYRAFAKAKNSGDDSWLNIKYDGVPVSEAEDHPVVMVSWEDAMAFCRWLSVKEGKNYRLPTDHEWSCAAGIGTLEDPAATPKSKTGKIKDVFPWGYQWPPPKGSGNFADSAAKSKFPTWPIVEGYNDGFATTSPVMSFVPNKLGLYDMAGEVWQWCEDLYDSGGKGGVMASRVMRGGSWYCNDRTSLLSSNRYVNVLATRSNDVGFRVVLVQ